MPYLRVVLGITSVKGNSLQIKANLEIDGGDNVSGKWSLTR